MCSSVAISVVPDPSTNISTYSMHTLSTPFYVVVSDNGSYTYSENVEHNIQDSKIPVKNYNMFMNKQPFIPLLSYSKDNSRLCFTFVLLQKIRTQV